MAPRLVVIGAGISGLAAARAAVATATEAGEGLEVVVLERGPSVGGKALTQRKDGWLIEGGPAGFLSDPETAPVMDKLIAGARMTGEVVTASEAAKHRFVVYKGRAREVRANPLRLVTAGILSPLGAARLLAEPTVKARRSIVDESVYDFAARRIGRQAAERLVAPMMLGIYAGDARRLSLHGAFPRLATLEREHGSLLRGMLATRGRSSGGPSGPAGTLTSFRRGTQSLALALAEHGGFTVHCRAEVRALARTAGGRWSIRGIGIDTSIEADAVVIASEAWATAALLGTHAPAAAAKLETLPYPPVVAISLGYGPESRDKFPRGFGCLVPRGEGIRSLGCVWDSVLFDDRAPDGHILVRVMLGGAVDPAIGTASDQDLLRLAHNDLRRLFAVAADPVFTTVVRWPRAIPQYEVGHPELVFMIEDEVARLGGIFLGGNALHGIAFAKAAATGWKRGVEAARHALGQGAC